MTANLNPLLTGQKQVTTGQSLTVEQAAEQSRAMAQELVDFYKKSGVSRAAQKGFEGSNFTPAEVPAAQYTDTLLQNAKAFSDVAIVTFSRVGGEGGDLPQDMYAAGYSKTDDGKHYLELTKDEEDLLALIKAQGFGKVIVLINSSNAMELGFLEDDSIDAALWIGSLGSTGFNAVGEILSGKVNPSGRLSDTYSNTAQQAMRRACHNILYTQANSIAIAATVDNTPYWIILLAIVDSILLIAIVLLILKRIPAGKKLERSPNAPHLIKTHIGVGYRMLRAENDKV